jgi:hypothetical protein
LKTAEGGDINLEVAEANTEVNAEASGVDAAVLPIIDSLYRFIQWPPSRSKCLWHGRPASRTKACAWR